MIRFLLCVCLISGFQLLKAQQMFLDLGKTITAFDYKNSDGEKLENLLSGHKNYMEVGFKFPVLAKRLKLASGITYSQYGASGSGAGYYYEWDMNYLGLNLGVEYDLWYISDFFNLNNGFVKDREGLVFYLKAAFSPELLMAGSQQINDQVYQLRGVEQFDQPLFFARGGGGFSYSFSQDIAAFVQYLGGKSFPLLKSDPDDQEKLSLFTHHISFGVLIGFSHK